VRGHRRALRSLYRIGHQEVGGGLDARGVLKRSADGERVVLARRVEHGIDCVGRMDPARQLGGGELRAPQLIARLIRHE